MASQELTPRDLFQKEGTAGPETVLLRVREHVARSMPALALSTQLTM